MPVFEIEQYEIYTQLYRLEADSEAEAIKKLFDDEAEEVHDSLEYTEVCEDLGLLTDDYPELAEALRALDVSVGDGVIPSIRSIIRVDKNV